MTRKTALAACLVLFLAAPALAQEDIDYFRGGAQQQEAAAPATTAAQQKAEPQGLDGGGEEYSGFGMKSSVVTPLDECLKQLPPDEALEVKTRYTQPYTECRARLASKASEKKHIEVMKEKRAAIPETPRNFVRVRKGKDTDGDAAGDAESGSLPFGIKPDNSTTNYNR